MEHAYDEWDFVTIGDNFLVIETLVLVGDNDWKSVLAMNRDGRVVILSYPTLHGFKIL